VWGAALFALCCWLVLHWLKQQPDFGYEMLSGQTLAMRPSELYRAFRAYVGLLLTTVVFAMPALFLGVALILRRPVQAVLASLSIAAVFAATFWETALIFPYLDDVVTQFGLFPAGLLLPGRLPVILPATACRLVTAVALGFLIALCVNCLSAARETAGKSFRAGSFSFRWEERTMAAILIPVGSVAGYLFVLIVRAKGSQLYYRYCLPILPLLVLVIIAVWQRCGLRSPGLVAWAVLVVFGVYGVAITHDHFEQVRAQLRAAKILEEAAVPRERILAGFEGDMWTQVALDGGLAHGADPLGHVPPNLHQAWYLRYTLPQVWYLKYTPRIRPLYFLATSSVPHMSSCKFDPVHYFTWFSPHDRQLLILCPE